MEENKFGEKLVTHDTRVTDPATGEIYREFRAISIRDTLRAQLAGRPGRVVEVPDEFFMLTVQLKELSEGNIEWQ